MTDEELERLANAVILLNGGTYGHAGATKLGRGVLTLLERVRKAEARVREMEGSSAVAKDAWCEKPVHSADGRFAGPCSLERGHEYECEYWLSGRHPSPRPR